MLSKTDLEIKHISTTMTIFQTLSQLPGAVPEPSQDENWKDYAYEFIRNLVPAGDEHLLDYFDNFSTSQIISIANLEDLINLYNQYNWIAHNNIIIQIENDLNDQDDDNDEDYQEMPDLISEYDSDEETQEYTANEPEQEETDSDMDIDTDDEEEETDSDNEDDNSNMDIETDDDEEEEDATEPIHYNITENQIFFVMQQTDSSYESAVNAISQYNGDIPLAVSSLYNQPENEIINDEDDLDIEMRHSHHHLFQNSYYAGYDNTNNHIIEILTIMYLIMLLTMLAIK